MGRQRLLLCRTSHPTLPSGHAPAAPAAAPAAPAATDGNATGDWLTTFSMWAEEGENGTTCQTFEPGYGWDYADPTIEYGELPPPRRLPCCTA